MATLHDFGEQSPPAVKIESPVHHPKSRRTVIGHIGLDEERDERVATFPRDKGEHFFRKYEGYAVSQSILDLLQRRGVETVLIVETTEPYRVIEYELPQFAQGHFVAYDSHSNSIVENEKAYQNDPSTYNDPQQVLPVEQAPHVWKKNDVVIRK